MGYSVVMQRLLLKRATAIVPAPKKADLDRLCAQLRRSFPEYQRQSRQEFSARLKQLISSDTEDSTNGEERLDETESDELSLDSEEEEVDDIVDEAISEFMASEGTEKVNKRLRDLYGMDSNAAPNSQTTCKVGSRSKAENKPLAPVPADRCSKEKKSKRDRTGPIGKRGKCENPAENGLRKKVRSSLSEKKAKDPPKPVQLTLTKSFMEVPRKLSYADLGGLEDVVQEIRELVEYPLKHPEVYDWLGVEPPRGVLLHGPPGCGKTALAHAIAHECQVPFFKVSAPEIVSGMSGTFISCGSAVNKIVAGESEGKIRTLFSEALSSVPSIIFIDEIDAIAAKRENAQREMERRIVAQMLTCMDDLSTSQTAVEEKNTMTDTDAPRDGQKSEMAEQVDKMKKHVIVLGATNRPDVLDPALRRAGRFDREISLGIPTEASRIKILTVMCAKLKLEGEFDFSLIARKTPGFVGADLESLTREAAALAVTRIFKELQSLPTEDSMETEPASHRFGTGPLTEEELKNLRITMDDFCAALSKVQPSLGREGFTTKPDITWTDIGSLTDIREELSFSICQPILHPEKFARMGLSFGSGVLLFGPPGCGKTLVAKAVANEAGTNFISIKGPELLNKYVGESERAVRQLFNRARAAKPCVLFFDEMDALAPKRGMDNNQVAERLVNQLLTEMDGMDGREGVYLIAATNRPDIIDPALLRPGRLDKILFVPLPDAPGRISILQTLSRKSPMAGDVDFEKIGKDGRCSGFSGADLAALVREACVLALKEGLCKGEEAMADCEKSEIKQRHFELALDSVQPSVSEVDVATYENMKSNLRKSRSDVKS